LPSFLVVTDGKRHESGVVRDHSLTLPPDRIVSVDRGYLDFKWLYSLTERGVFFVTRAKRDFRYDVTGQQREPKRKGVLRDETISMAGFYAEGDYPEELRRIELYDEETDRVLVLLTNHFKLVPATIAAIYKAR
jgi:hypothetical protein